MPYSMVMLMKERVTTYLAIFVFDGAVLSRKIGDAVHHNPPDHVVDQGPERDSRIN